MSITLDASTTGDQIRSNIGIRALRRSRPLRTNAPIWSPWADATRPSTTTEERQFRARLAATADPAPTEEVRRADITALVNALRSGLDADQLLVRAPGLQPARLAAAYDLLDERRLASVLAWNKIAASAHPDALDGSRVLAAMLIPRCVARLEAARRAGPDAYALSLDEMRNYVDADSYAAAEVEDRYDAVAADDVASIEVGRLLYAPNADGIAARPGYLASRLTMLSSVRVAALLGDRPEPLTS